MRIMMRVKGARKSLLGRVARPPGRGSHLLTRPVKPRDSELTPRDLTPRGIGIARMRRTSLQGREDVSTSSTSTPKVTASGIPVYRAFDELADVESLIPNPRNPNRHPESQVALLAKIIKAQGWRAPITVSNRSGFIVRGHCRLLAARALGVEKVPVDRQDYATEAEEWADLVADNRLAELAEMDTELLKDLLEDLDTGAFDMELTGFTEEDLENLMSQFRVPAEVEEDDFDVDAELENMQEPVTRRGDVWALGKHRLMCGDATDASDVRCLMRGALADLVFTDPPYNVDYTGKTEDALKIANDRMPDRVFREFLLRAYCNMLAVTKEGGAIYVCHADTESVNFRVAMVEAGWELKQCLVWVKQHFVMGRQDYHWRHEPILYGWKPGAAHRWYGGRDQDTVWEFDRPSRNAEHPTMKPVALVGRALTNSSKTGDLVLDLFGGSGTTLIAAEQAGRVCYMMEIDPRYCDVIVMRWKQLTQQEAVKVDAAQDEAYERAAG